jgi:hypothetical protein
MALPMKKRVKLVELWRINLKLQGKQVWEELSVNDDVAGWDDGEERDWNPEFVEFAEPIIDFI